jgi:hypothetical protein
MGTTNGDSLPPSPPQKVSKKKHLRAGDKRHSDGPGVFSDWLPIFAKYGGIFGLVLFVFVVLLIRLPSLPILQTLDAKQIYRVIIIFMVLVFVFTIIALVLFLHLKTKAGDFKSLGIGIFLLIVLLVCGIGAWARAGVLRDTIERIYARLHTPKPSEDSSALPPDLVEREWSITALISKSIRYQNTIFIKGDHTFSNMETAGHAGEIAPLSTSKPRTGEENCLFSIDGMWSYMNDRRDLRVLYRLSHSLTLFGNTELRESQQKAVCDHLKNEIEELNTNTLTCHFKSPTQCAGEGFELDLVLGQK